jgi:hypothetical protein
VLTIILILFAIILVFWVYAIEESVKDEIIRRRKPRLEFSKNQDSRSETEEKSVKDEITRLRKPRLEFSKNQDSRSETEEERKEMLREEKREISNEVHILNAKLIPLFNQLKTDFDENISNEIFDELKKVEKIQVVVEISDNFYKNALSLMINHNGNEKAKLFALNLGCWYYENMMDYWSVTCDEKTLQDDIEYYAIHRDTIL